jgi:hypothetical protein
MAISRQGVRDCAAKSRLCSRFIQSHEWERNETVVMEKWVFYDFMSLLTKSLYIIILNLPDPNTLHQAIQFQKSNE